jgi:hypothetical protein
MEGGGGKFHSYRPANNLPMNIERWQEQKTKNHVLYWVTRWHWRWHCVVCMPEWVKVKPCLYQMLPERTSQHSPCICMWPVNIVSIINHRPPAAAIVRTVLAFLTHHFSTFLSVLNDLCCFLFNVGMLKNYVCIRLDLKLNI